MRYARRGRHGRLHGEWPAVDADALPPIGTNVASASSPPFPASLATGGRALARRSRRRDHGPWITDRLGLETGDRLTLTVGEMDFADGTASAEHKGIPVAVAGAVPGETVMAEIVRRFPDRLAARVIEVMDASDDRVGAPCRYFLECSGCQWQHIAYQRQLSLKREAVIRALQASAAVAGTPVLETVPSPQQLGYRNHARFTVGRGAERNGKVGFVNAITRRFLDIEECLLMAPSINQALAEMQGKAHGMTQVSVRAGINSGDLLVQPGISNPDIELESGQSHLVEKVRDRPFRVAGSSFFQVNTRQAESMAALLGERLHLSGADVVVDAYCGVGVFAVLLAPRAGRVIGIEDSPSAVEDARHNAGSLSNVSFMLGRTEQVLGQIGEPVDGVVLDPPRAGCHPDVIAALQRLAPRRVVMVSCDPGTMVRDLAALCDGGTFVPEDIVPVDMFPQTRHVETVATLRLCA